MTPALARKDLDRSQGVVNLAVPVKFRTRLQFAGSATTTTGDFSMAAFSLGLAKLVSAPNRGK